MSSLVDKLRKAGKLHAEGEFTLDVEQAGSKLARFQFRNEHDFLFQMVAGLYRLGAGSVAVTYQNGRLNLVLEDFEIEDSLLKDLAPSLLEEFSPLRRLAAAAQALLAHEPKTFEWVGRGRDQVYDYLAGSGKNWHKVKLREIRLTGLRDSLVSGAVKELERAACYNRRRLSIQGRPVTGGLGKIGRLGDFAGWCFCDPARTKPDLRLVVDEMVTEPKVVITEIPWCGVVYWDPPEIRLDASLAAVVEDDTYQQLLDAIPSTYQTALLGILPELPRTQQGRDFLFDLMRLPAPGWLHSIYERLARLELFEDQRGDRWSLARLAEKGTEVYHLNRLPAVAVEETVLVEKSRSALLCLKIHLGDRLREANALVLEELARQANVRKWQERPEVGLALPAQNWFLQEVSENRAVGLPDDWSTTGGTITLVHGGRFLATRAVPHEEIAFHLVQEVDLDDINAIWTDISQAAFKRLEPQWLYAADELVKKLASKDSDLGPLRRHLLSHLARHKRPENSYFSKTLLFEDWQGRPYSLHSLVEAKGKGRLLGTVSPDHQSQEGLPEAIYLRAGPEELRCLNQVSALKLLNFDLMLEDLEEARRPVRLEPLREWAVDCAEPDYSGQVCLLPTYGQARAHVTVRGFALGWVSFSSALAFEAHLTSETLRFTFRLDNERLGSGRLTLVQSTDWKRCQAQLQELAGRSLQARLQTPLGDTWQEWARRGVQSGLALEFPALAEVACWDTLPKPSTLQQLLSCKVLHWCSLPLSDEDRRDFLAAHPQLERLFAPLEPATQQKLEGHYGGNWECVDAWFAKKARVKEFLRKAPERLGHTYEIVSQPAESPLRGQITLIDGSEQMGSIHWLHRDRLIQVEDDFARPGLLAQVECDQLQVNENFDQVGPVVALSVARLQVGQQMTRLLLKWLAHPQPRYSSLVWHWRSWEALEPAVLEGLRRQPWLSTNHGFKSWNELMQVEKLYRLPDARVGLPSDLTVVYEKGTPQRVIDQLMGQHPCALAVKPTERYLDERERREQQEAIVRAQSGRLKNHPFKVELGPPTKGEMAFLSRAQKDCWLITDRRTARIDNLPTGWAGYLETDEFKMRKVGREELADLSLPARKHIYASVLPALLRRVELGGLRPAERELVAEFVLCALSQFNPAEPEEPWTGLADLRWLPCADGTLVSLRQLRLETEERALVYWPKKYILSSAGGVLTPLLSTPLLLELVTRWCGQAPELRQKPLLHRDVRELAAPRLSNWRQVLEGLGRWVVERRPRLGIPSGLKKTVSEGLEKLQQQQLEARGKAAEAERERHEKLAEVRRRQQEARHQAAEKAAEVQRQQKEKAALAERQRLEKIALRRRQAEQLGAPLLTAVRRQASLLLQGVARKETMRYLERASWDMESSAKLWSFDGQTAVLYGKHPAVARWLGPDEPPAPVALSLLLGLVSVINARSEAFTDEMEHQFLERLLRDVVATYKDVM